MKQAVKEDFKKNTHGKESALDIKGSVFTLTVLSLKNADNALIELALSEHLSRAPRFFYNAPVVIDLKALQHGNAHALDFALLSTVLRKHHLVPVGVRHATPEQQDLAIAAGLAILQGGAKTEPAEESRMQGSAPRTTTPATTARIVTQPVRSGQQIYAKGSDLVLLAPVNAGAEVLADGNIHIYAPLRGRALAGVAGNINARIFTHSLEAELVSVAGHYRIFEQQPAADVHGKPVQIYLDNERLVITPLT